MASLLIVEDNFELAALIEAAAEARGHEAHAVYSGRQAMDVLARRKPDLAIVDLLLPDIGGGELLGHFKTAGVPAIAMSGVYKGSKFAAEAKDKHGALAFFEKPFPLIEMIIIVEAITGQAGAAAPLPRAEEEEIPLEVVVVEPTQPEPADLIPLAEWERIWRRDQSPRKERAQPAAELPKAGKLAETSVPRLLNAFFQAKHSGELVLHHPPAIKVVSFENGRPVYAASNLAHERFARFCARKGLLPQADLDAVAALAREEGLRTGVAMVKLDLITEARRVELLSEQIREIIWSTFSWRDGSYSFTRGKKLRDDLARLDVFPGELILLGYAQLPLVALRQLMPPTRVLVPNADPPYALEQFAFSYEQASMLAHADGTKEVSDLLALSDLAERDALAFLVALQELGFVTERKESSGRRMSFGL